MWVLQSPHRLDEFYSYHFPPSVGEGSTWIAFWMHTGSDIVVQVTTKRAVNPLGDEDITFTNCLPDCTQLVDAIPDAACTVPHVHDLGLDPPGIPALLLLFFQP